VIKGERDSGAETESDSDDFTNNEFNFDINLIKLKPDYRRKRRNFSSEAYGKVNYWQPNFNPKVPQPANRKKVVKKNQQTVKIEKILNILFMFVNLEKEVKERIANAMAIKTYKYPAHLTEGKTSA
jgi:hypothetical protein